MRHDIKWVSLLVCCAFILGACTQTASVGIPTPSPRIQTVSQADLTTTLSPPASSTQSAVAPVQLQPTPTSSEQVATLPAASGQATAPSTDQTPTATEQSAQVTAEPTSEATATAEPTSKPTAAVVVRSPSTTVPCGRLVTYIVRPGDNLFRIALRYRTTILAIVRRNRLPSTRYVRSGTWLRILTCARGMVDTSDSGNG